jgi:hypothetical protein
MAGPEGTPPGGSQDKGTRQEGKEESGRKTASAAASPSYSRSRGSERSRGGSSFRSFIAHLRHQRRPRGRETPTNARRTAPRRAVTGACACRSVFHPRRPSNRGRAIPGAKPHAKQDQVKRNASIRTPPDRDRTVTLTIHQATARTKAPRIPKLRELDPQFLRPSAAEFAGPRAHRITSPRPRILVAHARATDHTQPGPRPGVTRPPCRRVSNPGCGDHPPVSSKLSTFRGHTIKG